ncbi:unnamed protein product, partial [Phaeothamnion confervicola]
GRRRTHNATTHARKSPIESRATVQRFSALSADIFWRCSGDMHLTTYNPKGLSQLSPCRCPAKQPPDLPLPLRCHCSAPAEEKRSSEERHCRDTARCLLGKQ